MLKKRLIGMNDGLFYGYLLLVHMMCLCVISLKQQSYLDSDFLGSDMFTYLCGLCIEAFVS